MKQCKNCKGRGWETLSDGSIGDCLDCFATGDSEINPFARCSKCGGRASQYPPYECEKDYDSGCYRAQAK